MSKEVLYNVMLVLGKKKYSYSNSLSFKEHFMDKG